jgi:TPM domain
MKSSISLPTSIATSVNCPSAMPSLTSLSTFLGLTVALLFSATTTRAQFGGIRDNGAFFSEAAKAEASRHINEIGTRFKREVVIETFATIPDDVKKGVNLEDRLAVNRLFEQWTLRQARQQRVNGIYILLSKSPSHLQVVVGDETQRTMFTPKDRDVLVASMLSKLRGQKNDEALLEGVNLVAATMKNQVLTRNRGAVQAKSAAPATDESPNPWNWVIAAVLGFVVAWIVVGIFRAIFSGGGNAGAGGGGGVGGGSGGGFMSSLIGGMFGAAAGMWLYDQFSGHHNSDQSGGNFNDNDASRRDSDYSSSGDSFGDGSSGGDVGGGDSGGGDSGGGDF